MAPHKIKDLFDCENLPNFAAHYNAAPMQTLPIVIKNRMGLARWGFTPLWGRVEDTALAAKMINARSETVAEKPAFRESWHKARRCLIPANGFYEWKAAETDKTKTPYYIYRKDRQVMAFAGLWSKVGDVVTFTILTKDADSPIQELHKRMPAILMPGDAQEWFQASLPHAQAMIENASAADLKYHAVGNEVGKVSNNDASLLQAV